MNDLHTQIDKLMACPDCDILLEHTHIDYGRKASCPRCGHLLQAPIKDSVTKTLALALTGLLLFIPANFMPIMTLDTMGFVKDGSIFDCITVIYESGYIFVSFIVALTSFAFPLIKLSLLFYVSLNLKFNRHPHDLPLFMRCYKHFDEWGMLEVFMVGVLVSIIKLHHVAHIHYNVGFFCFIALLIIALMSSTAMDEHEFWKRIENGETDV